VKRKVKEVIKKENEKKDSPFNEIKIKSQAAMEYLMTYGWAILIIALSLVVLYSLGIMNPKNFIPRAPPGSCFVFRPNGPGTTDFVSLQGTCGYLPMYVGSFNGQSSYIQIPFSPTLNLPGNSESIFLWVKFSSGNYILFQEAAGAWNRRLYSTLWEFYDASHTYYSLSNGDLKDGNWHLVGYTVSGNTVYTYKDSKLVASATRNVNAVGPASSYWWLGRACSGTSCDFYFNGFITNSKSTIRL
jgi:hypothetical protein